MRSLFLLLLSLSIKTVYSQKFGLHQYLHCESETYEHSFFKPSKADPALKKVRVPSKKMLFELMENFHDTVVITINNKEVYRKFVQNQNPLYKTNEGLLVSYRNRYKKIVLSIFLVNENACVRYSFRPLYKSLAITRLNKKWHFGHADYYYPIPY